MISLLASDLCSTSSPLHCAAIQGDGMREPLREASPLDPELV